MRLSARIWFVGPVLAALFVCRTPACASDGELERIAALTTVLERSGIPSLLTSVAEQRWRAPEIPSRWNLENRSPLERGPIDRAARDLGKALALHLKDLAPRLQDTPADSSLNDLGHQLCDLAEWCGRTDGYGNVLLATRCIDLAAVAAARLTANLDFEAAKAETLINRLVEPWRAGDYRIRVLNREVGAEVFTSESQDEISRTWGIGSEELT